MVSSYRSVNSPSLASRIQVTDGRSVERHAGLLDLAQGALAVARGDVDRPGGLDEDVGVEAFAHRVEGGVLDAVVGSEPRDHDVVDTAIAEELLEPGLAPLARRQMRDAEPRVAVLRSLGLVDDVAGHFEVGGELGAPRVVNAVDRPLAPVLGEVRRLGWMPVLRVDDGDTGGAGPVDLAVDDRHHVLAALHVEAAFRVGEVVLHIDDDEGGPGAGLDCAHREPPRWEAGSLCRVPLSAESNGWRTSRSTASTAPRPSAVS